MINRFDNGKGCSLLQIDGFAHFDFRELQLVENAAQVIDLFVKLVPNLALRVLEIHRQFVFEPRDLLATHAASDKRHYHDDVAQPERDPEDEKYFICIEGRTAALRIILTCKIHMHINFRFTYTEI